MQSNALITRSRPWLDPRRKQKDISEKENKSQCLLYLAQHLCKRTVVKSGLRIR